MIGDAVDFLADVVGGLGVDLNGGGSLGGGIFQRDGVGGFCFNDGFVEIYFAGDFGLGADFFTDFGGGFFEFFWVDTVISGGKGAIFEIGLGLLQGFLSFGVQLIGIGNPGGLFGSV